MPFLRQCTKNIKKIKEPDDPSFRVAYGEGGYCQTAYVALTGQEAVVTFLHPNEAQLGAEVYHPWSKAVGRIAKSCADQIKREVDPELIMLLRSNIEKSCLGLNKDNIIMSCFKNVDNLIIWGDYLNNLLDTKRPIYDELSSMIEKMDNIPHLTTQDQMKLFVAFLDANRAPENIIELIQKYALKPYVMQRMDSQTNEASECVLYRYPARAHEAAYTEYQLRYYDDITKKLASNFLISASTMKKFKVGNEAEGLRHMHAYAVLGAKKEILADKTLYRIKLRNPWGETGMAYHPDKVNTPDYVSEEKTAAEFWIDLGDFVRYFDSYAACNVTTIGLKNDVVRADEEENTNKMTNDGKAEVNQFSKK